MLQYSTYSVMVSILHFASIVLRSHTNTCLFYRHRVCVWSCYCFCFLEVKEKLHQHLDKVEICILFSSKQEGLCTFRVNFAIGEGKFGLLFCLNSIQHLAFYAQTWNFLVLFVLKYIVYFVHCSYFFWFVHQNVYMYRYVQEVWVCEACS